MGGLIYSMFFSKSAVPPLRRARPRAAGARHRQLRQQGAAAAPAAAGEHGGSPGGKLQPRRRGKRRLKVPPKKVPEKKSQESATDVAVYCKSGTAPLRRRSGKGKIFRPRPLHSSHCAAFECFVNRFGAVCVTHFAAGITVLRIGGGRRTCCTNKVNVSRPKEPANCPSFPPPPP